MRTLVEITADLVTWAVSNRKKLKNTEYRKLMLQIGFMQHLNIDMIKRDVKKK